jgi:hypothetical protein
MSYTLTRNTRQFLPNLDYLGGYDGWFWKVTQCVVGAAAWLLNPLLKYWSTCVEDCLEHQVRIEPFHAVFVFRW